MSKTQKAMVQLQAVDYHYGLKLVLRGVSLDVLEGEVLALMGPNGSGKSTILSLMAGIHTPVRGTVRVDGAVRRSDAATELQIRRKIFYLPADAWLPADRTPREWLLGVGRLYEVPEERLMEHLERLIELFDLQRHVDGPIMSCSTGQKKKVSLAAALIAETPILLLDEPFSGGLDPSGILAMRRILQHLAGRDDVTIVLSTPVPELLEGIVDRIAVISGGQIRACDELPNLRRLAGNAETLADIYEHLVNPGSLERINSYIEGLEK